MKETAVDWFSENTFNQIELLKRGYVNQEEFLSGMLKLRDQAKEMEKEQMDKVAGDWWNEGASYMYDGKRKYESFEDYYNETFNTKDK
jgi:hypothetical protein